MDISLESVLQQLLFHYHLRQSQVENSDQTTSQELLFITRFPPIVGGVATQEYWRVRYLAQQGFCVRVVTNAHEADRCFLATDWSEADVAMLQWDDGQSGGMIRTYYTEPSYDQKQPRASHDHLPMDAMSHSKLVGLALKVIERYRPGLILSGYLEPYGSAAKEVSEVTGIPLNQYFAGSDIERLAQIPEMSWRYPTLLRAASSISTTWDRFAELLAMGVEPSRLSPIPPPVILPAELFIPQGDQLYLKKDSAEWVIGVYGKYAQSKCLHELLSVVAQLNKQGFSVTLLLLIGGEIDQNFAKRWIDDRQDSSVVWIDFIPPWKVPSFIRSCDIVCLLEESGSIQTHAPITPLEVAMCGVCPVLSRELFMKIRMTGFTENENCVVVEHPRDVEQLFTVLKTLHVDQKSLQYGQRAVFAAKETLKSSSIQEYLPILTNLIHSGRSVKSNDNLFSVRIWVAICFFPLTCAVLKASNAEIDFAHVDLSMVVNEYDYLGLANAIAEHLQSLEIQDQVLAEIVRFETARVQSMQLASLLSCDDYGDDHARLKTFVKGERLIAHLRYWPIMIELQTDLPDAYKAIRKQKIVLSSSEKQRYLILSRTDYKPVAIPLTDRQVDDLLRVEGCSQEEIERLGVETLRLVDILETYRLLYWSISKKSEVVHDHE